MKDWPASNIRELQQFLSFDNYYSRSFAHEALPISKFFVVTATMIWGREQKWAFKKLKLLLYPAPILALLDNSKPFDLHIDAFSLAIGSALMNLGHYVAYFDKKLNPAEINYITYNQDFLALFSVC